MSWVAQIGCMSQAKEIRRSAELLAADYPSFD